MDESLEKALLDMEAHDQALRAELTAAGALNDDLSPAARRSAPRQRQPAAADHRGVRLAGHGAGRRERREGRLAHRAAFDHRAGVHAPVPRPDRRGLAEAATRRAGNSPSSTTASASMKAGRSATARSCATARTASSRTRSRTNRASTPCACRRACRRSRRPWRRRGAQPQPPADAGRARGGGARVPPRRGLDQSDGAGGRDVLATRQILAAPQRREQIRCPRRSSPARSAAR